MNGSQFPKWVGNYIKHNFSDRGVEVFSEVKMGKTVIGKDRSVDLAVIDQANSKAIAIECKYQSVQGTADEKVPYALKDAEAMQMDCYVVYAGEGFSEGIKHMLQANELACCAYPSDFSEVNFLRSRSTKELDHILAMRFGWWDIFVANKTPL